MSEKEESKPHIIDTIIVKMKSPIKADLKENIYNNLVDKSEEWTSFFSKYPDFLIRKLFEDDNLNNKIRNSLLSKSKDYNESKYDYYYNFIPVNNLEITKELIEEINVMEDVEIAYLNAFRGHTSTQPINCSDPMSLNQQYLDSRDLHGGINARNAWNYEGANGSWIINGNTFRVKIIDIEAGWNFNNRDLSGSEPDKSDNKPIDTSMGQINEPIYDDHGTGIIGILNSQNHYDCIGICYDVWIHGSAIFFPVDPAASDYFVNYAEAIKIAVSNLCPGDIILIEVDTFDDTNPDNNRMPIELLPHNFDAILDATTAGIIVIEPAGNGDHDLSGSFLMDSGAIMVGALANSPNEYFTSWGKDADSNYGDRVDVCAWGYCVDTLDSDPLHDKQAMGNTSAASAIIAGITGSIQGIRRASGFHPYTPSEMRDILKSSLHGTSYASLNLGVFPELDCIIHKVQGNKCRYLLCRFLKNIKKLLNI